MPLYGGTSPATTMKQPEDKHLKISLPVTRRHWAFLRFYSNCTTDYVPFLIFFTHKILTFALWYPHRHCDRRGVCLAVMEHGDCQSFTWPRRRSIWWWCGHLRWHDAAHKPGRVICVAKTTQHRHSHATLRWHWRKYALEAIIKLLFISLFHDKFLLFMLELY